jgi:hypothetical protein
MVLAPAVPSRLLNLPLPGAAFYLVLAALLGIAAGTYLLAAWDPRRYAGVIGVAIVGRLLGATASPSPPGAMALGGLCRWRRATPASLSGILAGWPLRR